MYYPEYLHHRCNRIRLRDWSDPDEDEPALSLGKGYHQYEDRVVRQQWNSEKLEYDKDASRVIKKILQTCGWDWKTMTVGKLDQLDPRLVCLKCTYGHRCDGERRVSVRSWRSAVRSFFDLSVFFSNTHFVRTAGSTLHEDTLGKFYRRMGETLRCRRSGSEGSGGAIQEWAFSTCNGGMALCALPGYIPRARKDDPG